TPAQSRARPGPLRRQKAISASTITRRSSPARTPSSRSSGSTQKPRGRPDSESQCNRRLRALVELIAAVQQQLARRLDRAACASVTAHSSASPTTSAAPREASSPAWLATATKSRSTDASGLRGSSCSPTPHGLPLGYTLVLAGVKEYEPVADLLTGTPSKLVIARQGPVGPQVRRAAGRNRRRPPHPSH